VLHIVAEGAADVLNALGDIVIGDKDVRPERLHDRLTGQEPPGVFDQQP
jgi:hypothetical protein